MILFAAVLFYVFALIPVLQLHSPRPRGLLSGLLVPIFLAGLFFFAPIFSTFERMTLSTVLLLAMLKVVVALRRSAVDLKRFSRLGLTLYFSIWPGVEMRAFERKVETSTDARGLFRGAFCTVLGAVILLCLGWFFERLSSGLVTWAAFFGFLLCVHFGLSEILFWLLRASGFGVNRLFRSPWRSESLADFWSRRWNLAFVEMDRLLFLRPLRRVLGARNAILGVFGVSGLFHEIGISYPAGAGWGTPLLYFGIHGILVGFVEAKITSSFARRSMAWLAVLLPLPLLFHAPFRHDVVLPAISWLSRFLHGRSFDWYLHGALWLGSLGHFCVLAASFQVPKKLGWQEDFASLSRFNRKIFWTYGAFIVLCILSFGVLTIVLHDELFRGDKSAVALSIFIGIFWAARVATDLFYFEHDDWPRGWPFEIGHVALTFLFCCLIALFGFVVPLHGLRILY